jgi:ABC-type Zn uptake system ZnuABC Zn-binding protein ZnuA
MFVNAKSGTLFTILTTLLLIAAQCGAVQTQQETVAIQSRPAETEESKEHEEGHAEPHNGEVRDEHLNEGGHQDEDEHEHDETVKLSVVNLASGEKLKVVATTTIMGDLVRNVGGDVIELTTMLPIGADTHTFAPTPQDVAAVADAHVVFMNGLHLEEFLEELLENAGGETPVVVLSANVETRHFEEMAEHSDDEEGEKHNDEHGHAHEGADPHVWMTPANAIIMTHNIERALSELDPANAEIYKANAEAYEAQLEELDAWVKAQIETIPAEKRKLVTDHEVFGYYASRYGLEVVGAVIPGYSTNAEPSAQELAQLQEAIEKFDTKAVFVGTTANPVLAQDTGIQLVALYTESLGEPGSGAETYLDFIRYNTTAIVEALK